MKNLMLWIGGVALSGAMMTAACDSEVNTITGPTTATTGTGGSGGAMTTVTVSSTASSSVSSSSGLGGGNVCDQACTKVDSCGIAGACALIGLDCTDPANECPGACILDADCNAIFSLAPGGTPDPTLQACLSECDLFQGCQGCAAQSCSTQAQACQNDAPCQAYFQCVSSCTDESCADACASTNDSAATQSLHTCVKGSCSDACFGAGGAGGGGGAGGSGGSGGSSAGGANAGGSGGSGGAGGS